ncbi:MAG: 30S ribosomal protein S20 [Thermoleophilia bacterium]|nr:30S ribosomal protein S20 [Thermoleophilia bacterium]
MANTKQQRKRIKIAARQRVENLRYKSRIKTIFRSLTVAAQDDKEKAPQLGLELVTLIDKAASRGIIHPNAAAHKKSRVASIVELSENAGKTKGPATSEPKSGKSKKDRRAERHENRATRKTAVKEKRKRLAAEQPKAAEASPSAAEEASEEQPSEVEQEAGSGEAAAEAPKGSAKETKAEEEGE